VGGVAGSFEMTKPAGSSPCAIMACSSAGNLRMNSAENPPTVDCSVIGTANPLSNASLVFVYGWRHLVQETGANHLGATPPPL
jgi:hypothetical protein